MDRAIVIHSKKNVDGTVTYYFTKSKNKCLAVEYNKRWDFGKNSPSGTHFSDIELHNQNSFKTEGMAEVDIKDVPESIIDLLSFLK